jgi:hypothetical protein
MKLSELLTLTEDTAATHKDVAHGVFGLSAYSVDVDSTADLMPPGWLKEIGLVLKIDDQGQIDEDMLDVAISYRLAKVKVMVEVPYREDQVDEDHLMMALATNMQVVLSFLPPEDTGAASFNGYLEQTRRVCQAFFKRQNLDQMVMPVTNYLEYLFVNLMAPNRPFQVKDPYVLAAYADVLGSERTDALKVVIREEAYAHFGGQENFERVAKGLMRGVYDEAVVITANAKTMLEKNRDEQSAKNAAEKLSIKKAQAVVKKKKSGKAKSASKSK